jgi:5'(3')-deoxyribonucleotidase
MRVAIDVDSTLYDFESPMRQAFLDLAFESGDKETYFKGGYQSWVEWRSPSDVCGPDAFVKALERVHSPDVIMEQPPFPHAYEVVQELASEHDVYFISNRSEGSEVYDATYEWIETNILGDPELICTTESKRRWLEDTNYLIDDRPKTLIEFIYGYGPPRSKAFGLMFEYNRNLTDLDDIYLAPTWHGLEYYLKDKGVLGGAQ